MTQSDNDGLPTMGDQAETELTSAAPEAREEWKLRLKDEAHELDIKGMRLNTFINGDPKFQALPGRDQFLLVTQCNVMGQYYAILMERIFRAEHPDMAAEADKAEAEARSKGE